MIAESVFRDRVILDCPELINLKLSCSFGCCFTYMEQRLENNKNKYGSNLIQYLRICGICLFQS